MAELQLSYNKNDFLWNVASDPDNKTKSKKLMELANDNNGADERFENTMDIYKRRVIDLINIGVGLVACGVFIYFNSSEKKSSTENKQY